MCFHRINFHGYNLLYTVFELSFPHFMSQGCSIGGTCLLVGYFVKHALQISYHIWKVVFNVDQTIVCLDKNYIKQTNIQWLSRHQLRIWICVFLLFTMYVALLYKIWIIKQEYVVAVNKRNWPGKVVHFQIFTLILYLLPDVTNWHLLVDSTRCNEGRIL